MGLRVGAIAVVICVLSPVSSHAQFIWDWGQPQYTYTQPTPLQSTRHHKRHSSQATSPERTNYAERARLRERTKRRERVRVAHNRTWHDMSQDQARDWLKGQVQSFCGKYPKDQGCIWPKKEDDQ